MELDLTAETLTKPYVLLLWLSVVLVLGYIYYRYIYAPYQVLRLIGVEGPAPQVFRGNVSEYERMGEEEMFKQLYAEYGPISGFYLGDQAYLLVADLKLLKELMNNATEHFSASNEDIGARIHGLPPSLLPSAYQGNEWQRIRSAIASTLVPSKLVMMSPLLDENNREFLQIIGEVAKSKESTNIWSLYCSLALKVLCRQLGEDANVWRLGGESDLIKALQSLLSNTTSQRSSENPTAAATRWKNIGCKVKAQAKLEAVTKAVSKLVHKYQQLYKDRQKERQKLAIKQRQRSLSQAEVQIIPKPNLQLLNRRLSTADTTCTAKSTCKGFLQLLVEGSRSSTKDLTEEEMVSCCMTFLLSGYETIASVLAYTSYLLALNIQVQDKLCTAIDSFIQTNPLLSLCEAAEQIEYLNMVVQESLRFYPPTPKVVLSCTETCVVKGVTIPKGTKVVIPINLIHHNDELWETPDVFLPDRFSQNQSSSCHMPFGEGPQSCVGMKFVLMEVKLALIAILGKYKFVKALETEVPLESMQGVPTRRPVNGLYLKISNFKRI